MLRAGMVPAANFEGEYDDSKAISGNKFVGILSARTACPRRPMRGKLMRVYLPFCLPRLPSRRSPFDYTTWYRRIAAWVTQLVSEGAK